MADVITIPSQETQAPAGHDEKMATLGENLVSGGVPAAPAVDTTTTTIPTNPTETNPADAPAPAEDAATEALEGTGLALDVFEQEFAEVGSLSEESYQKLEKAGISKAIVDSYIAGQQALAAQMTAEAHALVGGADAYVSMIQWAATNLAPADKEVFNAAVDKGGASAKLAIAGLNAQFKATQGSAPKLLGGESQSGVNNVQGFRSTAELTAAMSDPRYAKDPAYRKDVETRLTASSLF